MKTEQDLYRALEGMQELEPGSLKGTETLKEIKWDSLASISFIAVAIEEFQAQIPIPRLQEAKTVADLWKLVSEYMPKE